MPLVDIQSLLAYPDRARQFNIQGRVLAELDISAHGRVLAVRIISKAGWGFDEEVMRKLRHIRFSPAIQDGLILAATVQIPVEFVLN
jgi:protein TonB